MEQKEKEAVKNKILKGGHILESEISSVLVSHGWKPKNNMHYVDLDDGKGREIDIIATKTFQEPWKNMTDSGDVVIEVKVKLIIECKRSESKWVFHKTTPEKDYFKAIRFNDFIQDSKNAKNIFSNPLEIAAEVLWNSENILKKCPASSLGEDVNLNKAKKDLFEATMQAIKATYYEIKYKKEKEPRRVINIAEPPILKISFTIPVLVLEGDLMFFSNDKKPEKLEEVNRVEYFRPYESAKYSGLWLLEVMKKEEFPVFLKDLESITRTYLGSLDKYKQSIKVALCRACRGNGIIECKACSKGKLIPQLSSTSTRDLTLEGKKGDLLFKIPYFSVGNNSIGRGKMEINFIVRDSHTSEIVGKSSKEILLKSTAGYKLKQGEVVVVNLGKMNKIKEFLGREPTVEDFTLNITRGPVKETAKCILCKGIGHKNCKECQ